MTIFTVFFLYFARTLSLHVFVTNLLAGSVAFTFTVTGVIHFRINSGFNFPLSVEGVVCIVARLQSARGGKCVGILCLHHEKKKLRN